MANYKRNFKYNVPEYGWGSTIGAGVGIAASFIPGMQPFAPLLISGMSQIGGMVEGKIDQNALQKKQEELQGTANLDLISQIGQNSLYNYADGGPIGPEYEAEDREVVEGGQPMMFGNGNFNQNSSNAGMINGATHEMGGEPMAGGERVFSDRLTPIGEKETFAQKADVITKEIGRFEKRLKNNDKIGVNSAKIMIARKQAELDSLFNQQEELKQQKINKSVNRLQMKYGGGLKRSEDYGNKSKPYPSVKGSDFAGGNRSYPIPTKADAQDALRLAGLHGRSDVRAKVYAKYPGLKKRACGGRLKKMQYGGDEYDWGKPQTEFYSGAIPEEYDYGLYGTPESTGKYPVYSMTGNYQRTGSRITNPYKFVKNLNSMYYDEDKFLEDKYKFNAPYPVTEYNNDMPDDVYSMPNIPVSSVPRRPTGIIPGGYNSDMKGIIEDNNNVTGSTNERSGNNIARNALMYGAQYAPAIYNLGKGIFDKVEKEEPIYNPQYGKALEEIEKSKQFDYDEARQAALSEKNVINKAASQSRSLNELLQNKRIAGSRYATKNLAIDEAEQRARSEANARAAQMRSHLGEYKAAEDRRVAENYIASRNKRSEFIGKGLEGVSSIAQFNQLTKNMKGADESRIKLLDSYFTDYGFSKENGWYHRDTGKTATYGEIMNEQNKRNATFVPTSGYAATYTPPELGEYYRRGIKQSKLS